MINKPQKQKTKDKDAFLKKLEKMYHNYGIDTSNMAEDEFDRLRELYSQKGKSIDDDLLASEKYIERFEGDIL